MSEPYYDTDLSRHRYPGIARVYLEMEYDNGGINRYRSEADALSELSDLMERGGAEVAYDYVAMNAWFKALSHDDLVTVVTGEESEAARAIQGAPPGTDQFLNYIFDPADKG